LDSNRSIAEVAKSIGVREMTLGKWVKKAKDSGQNRDKPLDTSEREELDRLRKENAELKMEAEFAKKSSDLARERAVVKYQAIADWAEDGEFSVKFMCEQLGLARSGYYRWLATGRSPRERTDDELTSDITDIHDELDGQPGGRRVWAELVIRGWRVAHRRVHRLMQAAGLVGRHPRKPRRTITRGQRPVDAPDLLKQDFTAAEANTVWAGDITYVATVD